MAYKQQCVAKVESVEVVDQVSLLDLPELTLECILGRLPQARLCDVVGVCRSLRDRCHSDHLWKKILCSKRWQKINGLGGWRQGQWGMGEEARAGGDRAGWKHFRWGWGRRLGRVKTKLGGITSSGEC
ncbi:hypothetical protein AAC387_Pa07g2252 [Persea americana]